MAGAGALLSRLHRRLAQRRFLPYREQAPPRTRAERRRWLALSLATWITMGGAVLSALPLIQDRLFVIKLAALLGVALPFTYLIHFTSIPRFWINWASFLGAVVGGYFEMRVNWPPGGGADVSRLVLSYRTLICFIFWVMAFRAFALRDVRDLVQSAIPAASAVLLVLIALPSSLALAGTALVVLGTLALLAGEQRAARLDSVDEVVSPALARGGHWSPALNSWLGLLLAVAIAGAGIAGAASRMELSSQTGRWLRAELAWRLAKLMMRESPVVAPERLLPLGGPAPPPQDRVLLTVRCDVPLKMRVAVYELYDGKSWAQAHRKWHRLKSEGTRWKLPPPPELGLAADAVEYIELEVRADTYFGGYLPVAWCVREIDLDIASLRHDYAGALSMGGFFGRSDSYRALIASPTRATPAPGAGEVAPVGVEMALQLPEELPARVRELARQIAAPEDRVESKALAIQGYLQAHCRYDLEAPELPEGADFVDRFLFEGGRGYCNHYASAMAVLCRAVGVPARLAAGFTPGRFDQRQGVFVIRDQDAHSWVEVFVPRVGWVDFDPTPSTDETDQGGVLSRLYLGAAAGAVRAARWLAARLGFMVAAGFVLLTATLTARHLSRWWRRRPRLLRAGGSAEDRVTRAYRQAAQWLAVSGAPRAPAAAPWEYCRQIEQRLPRVAQDLGLLTEKYVAARFGRSRPAESDAAAALAALARLRGGLFGARALTAREV